MASANAVGVPLTKFSVLPIGTSFRLQGDGRRIYIKTSREDAIRLAGGTTRHAFTSFEANTSVLITPLAIP